MVNPTSFQYTTFSFTSCIETVRFQIGLIFVSSVIEMDTPIVTDHENLEYPTVQPNNTRGYKNYANAIRRQSERVWRLHLNDEYDSSLEYCSHSTQQQEENNQEELDDIPSNALEILTKLFSIP